MPKMYTQQEEAFNAINLFLADDHNVLEDIAMFLNSDELVEHILDDYLYSKDKVLDALHQKLLDGGINLGAAIFRLDGYAGTGKTYLTIELLESLVDENVCLIAPTHKACNNIGKMLPEYLDDINISTVASFLGVTYNEDNNTYAVTNKSNREGCTIIIVDEVSMISTAYSKLFLKIFLDLYRGYRKSGSKRYPSHVKVIFVGDPAQLNPIDSEIKNYRANPPSPIWNYHCPNYKLTNVIRYDGDLARVAEEIRSNNRWGLSLYPYETTDDETIILHKVFIEWLNTASTYFLDEQFIEDPDYCRMIAYTNERVDDLNFKMRQIIHGRENLDDYIKGDLLIVTEAYHYTHIHGNEPSEVDAHTGNETLSEFIDQLSYLEPDGSPFNSTDGTLSDFIDLGPDESPFKSTDETTSLRDFVRVSKGATLGATLSASSIWLRRSTEMWVEEWDQELRTFKTPHDTYNDIKYTLLYITVLNGQSGSWIPVLTESSKVFYAEKHKELYDLKHGSGMAKAIYNEFHNPFAGQIKHAYALTCHRAQGSTIDYTFIDMDNISRNPHEKQAMQYVALTRTKTRSHIKRCGI